MNIYYPDNCVDETLQHSCDDCGNIELGRIRGAFYQKKGYVFDDITDPAEWKTAIMNGDVIIIPATHGTADGGTPNYGPGYGSKINTYTNTVYKSTYFDPDYKTNRDFYNTLKKSSNYFYGYVTSSLVHSTDATCVVAPKNPVADDINSQVTWQIEVQWQTRNETTITDMPEGIFDRCFDLD